MTVLNLFERFEDGLALMSLFERSSGELLANGCPIGDILNGALASERLLAAVIAERMRQRFDDEGWQYTNFYAGTRGIDPTPTDVERFIERSRQAGIQFAERA